MQLKCSMNKFIHIHTYIHIYISTYIFTYIRVNELLVYILIHTFIYIYTNTYTHTNLKSKPLNSSRKLILCSYLTRILIKKNMLGVLNKTASARKAFLKQFITVLVQIHTKKTNNALCPFSLVPSVFDFAKLEIRYYYCL